MTQTHDRESPARGRPRDVRLDERIVDGAAELLAERGYSRFTVGGVAARARVPRSTVYTRWAHASALLDELVARSLTRPTVSTGDRHADLVAMIRTDADWIRTPAGRAAARLLIDAVEPDGFSPQRTAAGLAERALAYTRCIGPDADEATRRRLELALASLWTRAAAEPDAPDLDAFGLATLVLGVARHPEDAGSPPTAAHFDDAM